MRRTRQRGFGVVDWLLILAVLVVGAAVLIPLTISKKEDKSILTCVENLRELDEAMRTWHLNNNDKPMTAPVTMAEILPYLDEDAQTNCPSGGHYIINGLTNRPTCTIPGHGLDN